MRSGDLGVGAPARVWARVFGAMLAAVVCLVVAPGVALGLPEGRVYEMVSPPYKGGYATSQIQAVAPSGESVAYYSNGSFEDAPSGP